MFIQVKLLKGFKEPLLYEVPSEWSNEVCVGSLVKVPLRNKPMVAVVEMIFHNKPATTFTIKSALYLEQLPQDPHYSTFISKLAQYYQTEPVHFIKRIRQFLVQKEDEEAILFPLCSLVPAQSTTIQLTEQQNNVVNFMLTALSSTSYSTTLLHGVTGSGKTEVYKKLIEQSIKDNKTVILLLPEVTLAIQFLNLLKQQMGPTIPITSFHSATSQKEKKRVWAALLEGQPLLIIGVHIPLLLPIQNLGLIIIDEEHDTGYQEKKHPKINSKEAALWRAQLANIPILLGSATPSLTSLYNVKNKGWNFFQLQERFSGIFPAIKIVQLPDKKQRKSFWISRELEKAIELQLKKKEQTLIFINRRGFSFFVQCKPCSFIFYCNACSVSLTLHENNSLICHYCGFTQQLPVKCTSCSAADFIKKGIGTQQIVSILQKMFPHARIERADLDITTNKKLWQTTVTAFQEGTIDILVGTQTITKGYHFPKVSLVGILWADLNLHFPIYNAVETTLQQLIQVAGRAGRAGLESTVIVQTMADHEVYSYLTEVDYLKFYTHELENRQLVGYPPCIRLAEIELKNDDESLLNRDAKALAAFLNRSIEHHQLEVQLLGPTKPPLAKIKNWHMRKIYLKSLKMSQLIQLFQTINHSNFSSAIFFTPNPLN